MANQRCKEVIRPHTRLPSEQELAIFELIHSETHRVVLVPVTVEGQDKFALAVLTPGSSGTPAVRVIAHLVLPEEEIVNFSSSEHLN